MRLNAAAEGGNVAAEKELAKMIEKLRQRDQAQVMAPPPTARPAKKGKKEAALETAHGHRGLYEPPPPPPAKMN
jgi:hypothetical protein